MINAQNRTTAKKHTIIVPSGLVFMSPLPFRNCSVSLANMNQLLWARDRSINLYQFRTKSQRPQRQ